MAAKGLADLSFQEQVDYVNAAQQRVSCETYAVERREDFQLTAGVTSYQIPDTLSYLQAIYNGTTPLDPLTVDDVVATLGGPGGENYVGPQGYCLVGTTLYILPTPAQDQTLEIAYYACSHDFSSDDELEINHAAEMAMEHLIEAYILLDSGETEMGVNCLALSEGDMLRVRRQLRGRGGHPTRIRTFPYDPHL